MAKLVLTIECEGENDVNDAAFLLFGGQNAVDQFEEDDIKFFGDFVLKHQFTFERED